MNHYIQSAYIQHCDRMRSINIRPLRYRIFKAMVEEILLDDVMAGIRVINEEVC